MILIIGQIINYYPINLNLNLNLSLSLHLNFYLYLYFYLYFYLYLYFYTPPIKCKYLSNYNILLITCIAICSTLIFLAVLFTGSFLCGLSICLFWSNLCIFLWIFCILTHPSSTLFMILPRLSKNFWLLFLMISSTLSIQMLTLYFAPKTPQMALSWSMQTPHSYTQWI